jgi:hypothetical protein
VGPVLTWCNCSLLSHRQGEAVQIAGTIADVRSRETPGMNVREVLLSTDEADVSVMQ